MCSKLENIIEAKTVEIFMFLNSNSHIIFHRFRINLTYIISRIRFSDI